MKELVINKPSELLTITNRNSYTKLILNCEVNPKLLHGFNNIKELTINCKDLVENHLNEVNLNKLPFINNIEIINLKNIERFGKREIKKKKDSWRPEYDYYSLKADNLKYLNFIYDKKINYGIYIGTNYLSECNNLEQITFNSNEDFRTEYGTRIPEKLDKIVLSFLGKEYFINLNYKSNYISYLRFDNDYKKIRLQYKNDSVNTCTEINRITDERKTSNELMCLNDKLIKDNILYIPDYITYISYNTIDFINKIEHISFNINLLNNTDNKFNITDNEYLNILKSIEIRTNKEMSLFPSIKINISDYGTIKDLYIKNNKLNIVFNDFILTVNKEGIISKEPIIEEIEEVIEEQEISSINLDEYSITELEEYLQYRKLLETYKDNDDEELTNAINIVGDRIIKKLTRK